MTLLLSAQDIDSLLPMRDCVDVLEDTFRLLAHASPTMPLRSLVRLPEHRALWIVMPLYSAERGAFTVKLVSEYLENPARHSLPVASGTVTLIDASSGTIQAIFDAVRLTALRTGALVGLATRHMANEGTTVVGVIGSGVQAHAGLEAIAAVRRVETAYVFSRTVAHRELYARTMSARLAIPVKPVDAVEKCVQEVDVLLAATNSATPVLDGRALGAGTHVVSLGALPEREELDQTTFERAARVVVDLRQSVVAEAGDIIRALGRGILKEGDLIPLADVVVGKVRGRKSADEVTVFKSVGFAFLDLDTARAIYARALEQRIGMSFKFA